MLTRNVEQRLEIVVPTIQEEAQPRRHQRSSWFCWPLYGFCGLIIMVIRLWFGELEQKTREHKRRLKP